MSKLPSSGRFLDFSDYARPAAVWLVSALSATRVSSIQITFAFFIAGLASVACIVTGNYLLAAGLLLVKNMLDAADGEMARVRSRPSQTGRFLDSIFDFIINIGIVAGLCIEFELSPLLASLAFASLELQGTIFNYYYLNQRRVLGGDTTSSVNEFGRPSPFPYESTQLVAGLHKMYLLCYGPFDRIMLALEGDGTIANPLPNWFMSLVSTMGLGFQLLLISVALVFQLAQGLLFLLCCLGMVGVVIVGIRKTLQLGERDTSLYEGKCTQHVD